MTTRASITVADGFGDEVTLYRDRAGYPDGRDGVLHTLRDAFALAHKDLAPGRFDVFDFGASIFAAWNQQGRPVVEVMSQDSRTDTVFHYDVLPSRGADRAVFVKVSGLEEPAGGVGPRTWVPLAAFLVFATRVRAVKLSKADQLAAFGRAVRPGLVARAIVAVEEAPPMIGEQRDLETAGNALLTLSHWLVARDTPQETVAAVEERGERALRRFIRQSLPRPRRAA